jgi:HEAT repeat protein
MIWILLIVFVMALLWFGAIRWGRSSIVASLRTHPVNIALNVDFLGAIPGVKGSTLPQLLDALEDEDARVRWHAAYAIGFFRPSMNDIGSRLIQLLQHETGGVRWIAAYMLGELGNQAVPAIPALLAAMDETNAGEVLHDQVSRFSTKEYYIYKDQSVRSASVEALAKIGVYTEPVLIHLKSALQDSNPFVRLDAAIALRKLEGQLDEIVPVLMNLMTEVSQSKRDVLRVRAVEMIGSLGPRAVSAVAELSKLVAEGKGDLREQAAETLGNLGTLSKPAVSVLKKALDDDAVFFQLKAAEALAKIDPAPGKPIWVMMDIMKDRSHPPFARDWARKVLRQYGPNAPGVVVALIHAKNDGDSDHAASAVAALSAVAPTALSNQKAILTQALSDPDVHVRVMAAETLLRTSESSDKAIPALMEALENSEVLARRWSARAMGETNAKTTDRILPKLHECQQDNDVEVRVNAAESIWLIERKSDTAVPALVEVVKNTNNPKRARERAAYALGRIGPSASAAVPSLLHARADESCWDVHVAAMRALELITASANGPGKANAPAISAVYPER